MTEALFHDLANALANPSGWMRRLTICSSNARHQNKLAIDLAVFAGDFTGKDVLEVDILDLQQYDEPKVLLTKLNSLKDIRRLKSLIAFGHHVIAIVEKNTVGDVLDTLACEFSQDGKKDLVTPINLLVDLYELPGKYSVVTHLVVSNDLQSRLMSNEPADWSLEALRECHFYMINERSRYHHLNHNCEQFHVSEDEIMFSGSLDNPNTGEISTAKGIS